MDLLKKLGAFFGWLSGVLAGVTAALYVLGFVATVTHQSLLGLDWSMANRDPLWFLGLGGQVAARWAYLAMVALLLVLVLGTSLRWLGRRARAPGTPRWIGSVARFLDRAMVWFIALLAMVLTGFMMSAFAGALAVDGLLLSGSEGLCRSGGVIGEIANSDRSALGERADTISFLAALVLGTGWYAVPRLVAGEGPAIPLLICIAVTFQALGAVPAAHGLFVLETRLPEIIIDRASGDADLRLLARAKDGLWVWEPASREIQWFAEGSFKHFEIGSFQSIHELACR